MDDLIAKFNNFKEKCKVSSALMVSLIALSILISIIIILKITFLTFETKKIDLETVPLIKSEVSAIKVKVNNDKNNIEESSQLTLYNIIENKKDNANMPVLQEEKKNFENIIENTYNIIDDQQLLADKINEINNDIFNDVIEIKPIQTEEKSVVPSKNNKKNEKVEQKVNVNIVKNDNIDKLNNKSLANNIKKHKDRKPIGGAKIQLVAMKNRDSLIKYWEDISKKYNNLFIDKDYYIEKVNIKNVGDMYRLQIGTFSSEELANNFCVDYIKKTNKSKLDCILVKD
jgi:hypothetical protein